MLRELVSLEQLNRLAPLGAAAALFLAIAIGAIMARIQREGRWWWLGLAWGSWGPLALLLWWGMLWAFRLDPRTGYVGLYRPPVLVTVLLVFLGVGAAWGLLYRRLADRLDGAARD
jgi:hypothetical protein